jgi:hypothetical protein
MSMPQEEIDFLVGKAIDAQIIIMAGCAREYTDKDEDIWLVFPVILSPIDHMGEYYTRRWALLAMNEETRQCVYSYFPPSPFAAWTYDEDSFFLNTCVYGDAEYPRIPLQRYRGRTSCPECEG